MLREVVKEHAAPLCSLTSHSSQPDDSSLYDSSFCDQSLEWLDKEHTVQTVMIRGIPCKCTREDILEAVEELGFAVQYDFFYVPLRRGRSLGYAFIGFPLPQLAKDFAKSMTGYRFRNKTSAKTVTVVPASVQGVGDNLDHFKSTSVMQSAEKPLFPSPPSAVSMLEVFDDEAQFSACPSLDSNQVGDGINDRHSSKVTDRGDAQMVLNEGIAYIKFNKNQGDDVDPGSSLAEWKFKHDIGSKIIAQVPDRVQEPSTKESTSDIDFEEEPTFLSPLLSLLEDESDEEPGSSHSVQLSSNQLGRPEFIDQGLEWLDNEDVQTVMIRGIPCSCNKEDILEAIEGLGFAEHNFFYVPLRRGRSLGYAFIGFQDPQLTKEFARSITGYRFSNKMSSKTVSVVPANVQGLNNNLDHFMSTSVMRNVKKQPMFSIQC